MRMIRLLIALVLIGGLLAACAGPAAPGSASGKALPKAADGTLLRKIQDRGKIIVGVKYDVPMFGLLNPTTNKVEGFDVDVAKEIASYIFGNPDAIEFKEAVSKNRIPFLQDGTTDLIASTMTINADREKQIDFSVVYYLAGQSLLVPKASTITGIQDLAGKKVGTAKGSTSENNIRAKAPKADVQLFDGYAEAVAAMDAGRVEAVTTDDNILIGFQSKEPNKWKVVGGQFTKEPYGIGIAQGHKELVEVVNKVVKDLKSSGKWKELYKKNIPADPPAPPDDDWHKIVGQ
ncbi:MAG TPA: glutamate ABC transporter substrate-binding protein [Anaerolineae bacterium]